MAFHWSLSDSKSPQISRTLLSILAVLNNAVVWVVYTRLPTSTTSRPFNNPLFIVPKAPITIGAIGTFMFYSFFNSLTRSRHLSFFSNSLRFILWSARTEKSIILQIVFFLLIIIMSGLLAGIRWSVCKLKSHRSLCVSFSRPGAGWCIYHLLVWSNLNFWHIEAPCQPSRVSPYTPVLICCISLLCDWSFHLCHHIAYICYFVAFYLFSLWYDWFLSCATIRRDSVSLLRFSFLSQVQGFWCEMLFISRLKRPLCFFPILFLSCFYSIVYRLVRIVSDGCNQSSFVFFYVVFEPLYRWVNTVFDAGKSSSSLFSRYI